MQEQVNADGARKKAFVAGDSVSLPYFVAHAFLVTARSLFGNLRALVTASALYILLLTALYLLIVTREANFWQVGLTFTLIIVTPILFFALQALGVSYVDESAAGRGLPTRALKNFWKLFLVTIPLILLAWLIVYLFNKFPDHNATNALAKAMPMAATTITAPRQTVHSVGTAISWAEVALASLRFLLLYFILPLIAIHLWIIVAHHHVRGVLQRAGRILTSALAPPAVLIYALGMLFFGLIPYLLFFMRTSVGGAWTEIVLLSARLVLALAFIFFGWMITLGALVYASARDLGLTVPRRNDVVE